MRGYVDLRYGVVSLAPPVPLSELLARPPSQLLPFAHYLQRMVRFLQVALPPPPLISGIAFNLTPPPLLPSPEIRPPLSPASALRCMDGLHYRHRRRQNAQLGAAVGPRALMPSRNTLCRQS